MVNLDCLIGSNGDVLDDETFATVEFDRAVPRAIIETKGEYARLKVDANFRTLRTLANMAGLPFFLVQYSKEEVKFVVYPGNRLGENFVDQPYEIMTEDRYIRFLYRLRGK